MKASTDGVLIGAIHGLLLFVRPIESAATAAQEICTMLTLVVFTIFFSSRMWDRAVEWSDFQKNILISIIGFAIGIFFGYVFFTVLYDIFGFLHALALALLHGMLIMIPTGIILAHALYNRMPSAIRLN